MSLYSLGLYPTHGLGGWYCDPRRAHLDAHRTVPEDLALCEWFGVGTHDEFEMRLLVTHLHSRRVQRGIDWTQFEPFLPPTHPRHFRNVPLHT